jgi:hypothetical protein
MIMMEFKVVTVQNIVLLKILTTFDLLFLWGSKYNVKKRIIIRTRPFLSYVVKDFHLTFIGQLSAFQNLCLWSSRLQELLTFIGQLIALKNFRLWGCSRFQELPTFIGQLNALQNFNLHYYSRLQ